jgi:peptide/nickel transport system ATP-binding protein
VAVKINIGECHFTIRKATSGQILYRGQDITKLGNAELKKKERNSNHFQDPYSSLNPRIPVGKPLWNL